MSSDDTIALIVTVWLCIVAACGACIYGLYTVATEGIPEVSISVGDRELSLSKKNKALESFLEHMDSLEASRESAK